LESLAEHGLRRSNIVGDLRNFTESWLAQAKTGCHGAVMSIADERIPSRRAVLARSAAGAVAACGILSRLASPALAGPKASPWARGMSSRIRLAEAGLADAEGLQVAVVEIALDKGFKTYWRTPGDSGIPPVFAFDGSENARDIQVHFPAPVRFDDGAGGHSIGYRTSPVELPVTFRAANPAKPVKLALKMDYAVCEKICVPASGAVELTVEPAKAVSVRAVRLLSEHLPRKLPLAAKEPLAVDALGKAGAAERFRVAASLPGPADADLFVEAPSPWLFDTVAPLRQPDGKAVFTVVAVDKDKSPDCRGVEITLTLVQDGRAVETTTWLDVSLLQA
jgi:DsbC/DsbD-like thiol-disulfide interchange protein